MVWQRGRVVEIMPLPLSSLKILYHFTAPVTINGGMRACRHVPDGSRTWTYILTRNSTGSSISIDREIDSYNPGNPESEE